MARWTPRIRITESQFPLGINGEKAQPPGYTSIGQKYIGNLEAYFLCQSPFRIFILPKYDTPSLTDKALGRTTKKQLLDYCTEERILYSEKNRPIFQHNSSTSPAVWMSEGQFVIIDVFPCHSKKNLRFLKSFQELFRNLAPTIILDIPPEFFQSLFSQFWLFLFWFFYNLPSILDF